MWDVVDKKPWVSFCISTYQRPELLKSVLESIRVQTFKDFEVVISDNDPAQSAKIIVEELADERFYYFHNSVNIGMIKSFNKSLERSKGRYIVIVTDDDPLYPNMLEVLYDLYEKFPGYGLYFGSYDICYENDESAKIAKAKIGINKVLSTFSNNEEKIFSAGEFPNSFFRSDFGGGVLLSTAIVERNIAISLNGLPDYETPCMADCAYILLAGVKGGAVFKNTALGLLAIHNNNFSYTNINFDNLYKAPSGCLNWITNRIGTEYQNEGFEKELKIYIGKSLITYFINIKKRLVYSKINDNNFEKFIQKIFKIEYMKRWRLKYLAATKFPFLFKSFVFCKQLIFNLNKN